MASMASIYSKRERRDKQEKEEKKNKEKKLIVHGTGSGINECLSVEQRLHSNG